MTDRMKSNTPHPDAIEAEIGSTTPKEREEQQSAATTATRWECQVAATDPQGDMTIFDVTFETPDVNEAIRRLCRGLESDDIEWIKVRRV